MKNEDVARLVNPYQFSHPVRDRVRFFGRDKILEDVEYYLDQAQASGNPINLALIGARASGKTSLLNMIGWEAEERGFCVVDIPLNEDDARSDIAFFYKLVDAVFNAALQMNANPENSDCPFGGEWQETHRAYLKLTSESNKAIEFSECPLRFAHFYSHMRGGDLINTSVNDSIIRQDLKLISNEVGRPIVILLDEANVLTIRHTLLQKIRNIFQSISGFMLVIAGTEGLFPSLDEVYSPIARDFKRIEVGPFESSDEARSCILEPLELLGLSPGEGYISAETLRDLSEIDGFTGGSPYQIQLACHFLFREMQVSGKSKMLLTIDTLNAVIQELSIGPSTILNEIRALSIDSLRDLSKLLQGDPEESLASRLCTRSIFFNDSKSETERLGTAFVRFQELSIIQGTESKFDFAGDEREFLYLKYYARARGVRESISDLPASIRGLIRLSAEIRERTGWNPLRRIYIAKRVAEDEVHPDIFSLLHTLTESSEQQADELPQALSSEFVSDSAVDLLIQAISEGYEQLRVGKLQITSMYFSHEAMFTSLKGDELNEPAMDRILQRTKKQSEGTDATIEFDSQLFTLEQPEVILENIARLISLGHADGTLLLEMAVSEYLDDCSSPKSKTIVSLLKTSETHIEGNDLNNFAYLLMAQSEWKAASRLLIKAKKHAETQELVNFNLSVCAFMRDDIDASKHFITEARIVASERPKDWSDSMACLFIPRRHIDGYTVEEKLSPYLLEEIESLEGLVNERINTSSEKSKSP